MAEQTVELDLPDEPPASRRYAVTVGLIGLAITFVAFIWVFISGGSTHGFDANRSDGFRMVLVFVGMITAGSAIVLRPHDGVSWLPFAAAGLICYGVGTSPPEETSWITWKPDRHWYAAIPNSWDSYHILGGVLGLIGLAGALFNNLSRRVKCSCIFAVLAFYFSGILASVLSPPATPYLVDQYWRRISRYHSQFLYINNAYHFYSPEPGPPSELWVCIKYKPQGIDLPLSEGAVVTDDVDWVKIPTRLRDTLDPLRLSYLRRLALCEQTAQVMTSPNTIFPEELQQLNARRLSEMGRIPKSPTMPDSHQFVPPNDMVVRQVLPSFAKHFAIRYGKPGKEVASVRIYRALHEVLPVEKFRTMPFTPQAGPEKFVWDPWNEKKDRVSTYRLPAFYPTTYHPYYQGEYDLKGNLLDSTDPLLYWLVPIIDRPNNGRSEEAITNKNFDKFLIDYVSIHAGSNRPKE